jgi:hypothetical protein
MSANKVEEKLFQNRYRVDAGRPHISIKNPELCTKPVRPALHRMLPGGLLYAGGQRPRDADHRWLPGMRHLSRDLHRAPQRRLGISAGRLRHPVQVRLSAPAGTGARDTFGPRTGHRRDGPPPASVRQNDARTLARHLQQQPVHALHEARRIVQRRRLRRAEPARTAPRPNRRSAGSRFMPHHHRVLRIDFEDRLARLGTC